MSRRFNRREFLSRTAAGATATTASAMILPAWADSPNEKLDVAVVGVAGRGGANLGGVSHENIVALCDVDANRLAGAAGRFPRAKTYADFRKMLDATHKQIDAVVVSTPDHTHAPVGVAAMKLGKHCYSEKPMTQCVYETRTMTDAAIDGKLVTQLGTQIHAGGNYRRVVELVRAGAVGPIGEVHVWCGASYSPGDRPKETPPVPPHLDWDLWLGPAPVRPYHPAYVPGRWRGWWDFANGGLGDFFCHYTDLAFWALKLKYPTTVEAEGAPLHAESCPRWLTARYEFPKRDDLPPVKLTWYDGGKRPTFLKERGVPEWGSGVLFIGERGMLLSDYGRHVLLPAEKFADFKRPEPTIPNSIGHHREWTEACKTGGPTTCNFAYSGPLTEAALLAAVSFRTGEKLQWDAAALKATNCPAADRYIRRQYRKGWEL
ncbi:MAG: Gfo/Idh/MocA family oxidoreductase [Candidatus Nealsonbacteria bacterium]|nr:Gfo/Idh/MocA family oxidoreductase [Candidatus Nealsonbacteria bacterium]